MIGRHLCPSPRLPMPLIELPRALEDYFAFAETEPTRRGRRFSITLPFHNGEKLERLQWWYHVSPAEEQMFEGHGMLVLRARGIQRFCRHIERWLEINRLRLHGEEPIPRLSRQQHTTHRAGESHHHTEPQSAATAHADPQQDAGHRVTRRAGASTRRKPRSPLVWHALPAWPLVNAVNG